MKQIKFLGFLVIFLSIVIVPAFSATSYTHELGIVDFDTHQLIPSTVKENTGFGIVTQSNSGQYYTFTVKSNFVVVDESSSPGYDPRITDTFYDAKLKQSCLGRQSCTIFTNPVRTTCEFDHITTTGFERFNCNVENTNNRVMSSFDYFAKSGSNIEIVRDLVRLKKTVVNPPKNNPPVAILLPNQTGGAAPLAVKFTIDGNDADGFIKKWSLSFGDGQSTSGTGDPNGIFRVHSYANPGSYKAKLIVEDNGGASAQKTVTINVGPPLPLDLPVKVSLSAQPVEGFIPLTVNFACKASGNKPFNYKIAFGDGNLALDIQSNKDEFISEHIYRIAGNFEASCSVTDSDGDTNSSKLNINAKEQANNPPIAVLSANTTSGIAPLTVKFTLDGSDLDGSIKEWRLIFGDTQFESGKDDPNELMIVHTYANSGLFVAKLRVVDNKGAAGEKSVTINVLEKPKPQCSDGLDNDLDGSVDFPADFGCESLSDNSEINNGNTQCSDGLDNDLDGKIDQKDPQCENRNDDNESDGPEDKLPKTDIKVSPASGVAPLQSVVECSVKSGDAPFTYLFSFGDGTQNVNVGPTNLISVDVNHVYLNSGQFTTSCKVTDVDGDFDLDSKQVFVSPPKNNPPVAILVANTTSGPAPLTVKLTLDGVDSDGFITSWVLLFGDGQSQFANGDPNGLMITHTYANPGAFVAKLTVTDNRGAIGIKTLAIVVGPQDRIPNVSLASNVSSGVAPLAVGFNCSTSDGNAPFKYNVSFGDGSFVEQNTNQNSFSTQHTYQNAGNFLATCRVTDVDGDFDLEIRSIQVSPPLIQCSDGLDNDLDGAIDFPTDTGCSSLSDNNERGNFVCDNGIDDDSDGLIDFPQDLGCSSISDNDERNRIDGQNRAPVADFSFTPKNPFANRFVLFDGSLSVDPDGDVLIYSWDFDNNGKIDSKIRKSSFKFAKSGRFRVTLTVSDGTLKDSETKEVAVKNKDGSVDEQRGLSLRKRRQLLTQMFEPEFLENFEILPKNISSGIYYS